MDIQVLLEPIDGGFRASALTLSAEGATEDDALARLKAAVLQRLAAGAKVVSVPMPELPPFARFAGTRKTDDPVYQEWWDIIQENRRKDDLQENPPW
jgi:thioesterase domain-containing protein